jgi:hypothetical protein
MTELQTRKCAEVHLSGWLANITTGSAWHGDSHEEGSLFSDVTKWLKRDDRKAGSFPLKVQNADL